MSQRLIRKLFEQRLIAWAAARSPALPIAFENVPFDPAGKDTYLKAFLLPARSQALTLDGPNRTYLGLFQVSIVTKAGIGAVAAENIAAELEAQFPVQLRMTSGAFAVQVIEPMSAATAIIDGATLILPVSCNYRADV